MNLLTESLWGDEAFSALAIQLPFGEMLGVVMKDTSPPLFYLVGFIWGRIFGFNEISLRSLCILLIAGTGILAGLTVWELGKGKINALGTLVLTVLAPFLFLFAFEWRMYALLAFTITASTYCFLTKRWRLYAITALASLYTHHFAIFTIFAQGLCFLVTEVKWKEPKKIFKQLWPYYLIALGYAFWLYPMYIQVSRVKGAGFWLSAPNVGEVINLTARLVVGGIEKPWQIFGWVLVIGMLLGKDWRGYGKKVVTVLVISLMPIVLSALASYVITPIFYDRYLLSVIPGIVIALTLGLRKEVNSLILVMILLYGQISWQRFNKPTKRPFAQMAEVLRDEIKDGDVILNFNGKAHHLWESKYYRVPGPIYTPNGPLPLYVGTAQMKEEDTTEVIPKFKRRLIVISSEDPKTIELPGLRRVSEKLFENINYSFWVAR